MIARTLNVVAIGGGTGLSALLQGLKQFTAAPGEPAGSSRLTDLAALVTVMDDGGSSGRLREEFGMLPPGDIRNCLVALSDEPNLLRKLFQYRFASDGDLQGHNFGNLFLAALASIEGDFLEAIRVAGRVLKIRGRIFPVTTADTVLVARLQDGRVERGETHISRATARIERLELEPADCRAVPEALDVVERADLIVIGPGSLYTSLIPNLLVRELAQALAKSRAIKIYVANLMTQPGETSGYTLADHLSALEQHAPGLQVDAILANSGTAPRSLLDRYAREGSVPVVAGDADLSRPGMARAASNLLAPGDTIKHDSLKTATALLELHHAVSRRQRPAAFRLVKPRPAPEVTRDRLSDHSAKLDP